MTGIQNQSSWLRAQHSTTYHWAFQLSKVCIKLRLIFWTPWVTVYLQILASRVQEKHGRCVNFSICKLRWLIVNNCSIRPGSSYSAKTDTFVVFLSPLGENKRVFILIGSSLFCPTRYLATLFNGLQMVGARNYVRSLYSHWILRMTSTWPKGYSTITIRSICLISVNCNQKISVVIMLTTRS